MLASGVARAAWMTVWPPPSSACRSQRPSLETERRLIAAGTERLFHVGRRPSGDGHGRVHQHEEHDPEHKRGDHRDRDQPQCGDARGPQDHKLAGTCEREKRDEAREHHDEREGLIEHFGNLQYGNREDVADACIPVREAPEVLGRGKEKDDESDDRCDREHRSEKLSHHVAKQRQLFAPRSRPRLRR
jgi:hypothetical protein